MGLLLGLELLGPTPVVQAQGLTLTAVSPTPQTLAAPRNTAVVATFNQPLSNTVATQNALRVFSQQLGGRKAGTATVNGNTLTFDPTTNFKAGETVYATLTAGAQSTSGTLVSPQVFQFTTATNPSTGTFGAAQTVALKENTVSQALGDVDGDGDLDLLTANTFASSGGSTVSVRLNNGQGGFGNSAQEVSTGQPIYAIALGDVDGDGDLDLLTANQSTGSTAVSVRLNNGSGFFAGGSDLALDIYLTALVVGDLDADGDLDLVTCNVGGNLFVRLNNGDGTFGGGSSFRFDGYPRVLRLADIDNDGDLDLAAVLQGGQRTGLARNNGNGTFGAFSQQLLTSGTNSSADISFGDVDGDGDLDLATANGLFLNSGSGTFRAPQTSVAGTTLGDVDGDGDLDLLLPGTSTTTVHLNNGTGTFTNAQPVSVTGTLELADLDGNNTLDLVVVTGTTAGIALNQPSAASTVPTLTGVSPSISPVGSSVVLTGTNFTGATSVTFNGVTSSFVVNSGTQITATLPANTTSGPVVVTTPGGVSNSLNFTVGPRPAVVSTSPAANAPTAPRTAVAVTFDQPLSNGSGIEQALRVFSQQAGGQKAGTRTVSGNTLTFTPTANFKAGETVLATVTTPASNPRVLQFTTATAPSAGTFSNGVSIPVGNTPNRTTTGDVDGDGDLDLILSTINGTNTSVVVRLNTGAGTYTNGQELAGRSGVVLADVDGDADLDLLTVSNTSGTGVLVYLNNGGTFTFFQSITVLESPQELALADLDADGDLDLVTTAYGVRAGSASVRLNNGAGVFGDGQNLGFGRSLNLALGDVDNDGDVDILVDRALVGDLELFRNNGSGTFGQSTTFLVGTTPNSGTDISLGDLDNDGDLDVVSAQGGLQFYVGLNNGSGTFTTRQFANPLFSLTTVSLGDVDGDGDLDFNASVSTNPSSIVWINDGTASFRSGQFVSVRQGLLSDLDGDNDLDLIGINPSGTLSVLLNQNTTTPPPPTLTVVSLTPARNAVSAPRNTNVAATFSQPLSSTAATQGAVTVFGQQTGGRKAGTATVSGNTLTFDPTTDFKAGEQVLATFTTAVQSSTGGHLAKPQVFQFTTATAPSTGVFTGGASRDAEARNGFIGDLNGDGRPDLIDYTYGPFPEGTIRLSNGDGTYGSPKPLSLAYFTRSLALGDVDEDGDLDLISAHNVRYSPEGFVSVRLNNGQGAFSSSSSLTVGSFPTSATLSDVNGDGHLDLLLISDIGATALSIRFGNGNGTFRETGQDIPAGETPIVPVDIDNDGDLDLFTGNQAYRNDGTGYFAGSQAITADDASVFGDLDGDGDLDIVTSGGTILRNNGAGTFTASGAGTLTGNNRLGDVDGDGDLDLVSGSGTTVRVRLNDGTGLFGGSQQVAVAGTGLLSLADVDGDGDLDILASNGQTVSLRLNGAADFVITGLSPARNAVAAPRPTDVAVTFSQALANTAATQGALKVYSAQAGGLKPGTATVSGNMLTFNPNANFKPGETVFASVLSSVQSSGGQSLAKGQVFQFTAATVAATAATFSGTDVATGAGANGTATGDVDGDGDLDLLTANMNASTVSVRFNNGSGAFTGSQEVSTDSGPYAVALGDVDGDGDLDLVTANANRRTVSVRLNNGSGVFSGSLNVAVGVSPHAVALGDVDADGDLDLLAANYTDGTDNNLRSTVSVRLNNGLGSFSGSQEVSIGTRPLNLVLGDVDNDGDLDFATANSNSNTASVRLNDGAGTFSGTQNVMVGYQPHGVVLADVDGDGDLDLLAAHLVDSGVSVRLNDGSGAFSGSQEVAVGNGARSLAVGDLDGDGDLDLLAGNVWGNTVSVRLNSGTGIFSGSLNVPVGAAVSDVRVGDLDGNGTLDFVTANATAGSASVRLNAEPATATATAATSAEQTLTYVARRPQELSVYPNPAHGRVQLQLPLDLASQSVQVSVRNALGQVVLEKTLAAQADTELALAHLPAGLYTVQVRAGQRVLRQRLVVE